MESRSWYKVILLVVLACILHKAAADCKDEGQTCGQCYQTLASYLVNTTDNKYQLRRVFYPIERASPIFVTVTYQYIGSNTTNTSIPNKVWYWSTGVFYFFQPPRVFQLTSLLFGGPYLRSNNLSITLPAECESAPEEFMIELTQLLKLYASWSDANPRIDNTYRGDAYNLDTLNRNLYTDVTFINANHPILLYCFQFLFPLLTAILIVFYVICSHPLQDVKKDFKNLNSFATTTAHAVISLAFILYVFVLDIVAVAVRNETPEYYSDTYNKILFDYPGVLLLWDILALCGFLALVVSLMVAAWRHNENTFPLLVEAGMVPLLCLASHAHYILIAWITDPFYATSVGIYYGICYIIHLLVFKKTYTAVYYLSATHCCLSICKTKDTASEQEHEKNVPVVYFNCKAMCTAIIAFFVALGYQALITLFIVFIPINNAIENTPSRLFIAIQSVGALLLGFIACKIIIGKESLSIIIGAIRNVIKMPPKFYTGSATQWSKLGNEEKFAEVLHHVFKTNSVHDDGGDTIDNTTSATTTPASATTTPASATTTPASATTTPASATITPASATTTPASATTAPASTTTAPASTTTGPASTTTLTTTV